jgi:hypothetical protein
MDKFNPDTYCGIYRGACSIVMRSETGRTDGFADCLGSVPKEDLACSGANPTPCMQVAAHAISVNAPARKVWHTASIAPIIRVKCTANGNQRRSFSFRTAAMRYPAWRRLNAMASPPGSQPRKGAGRVPTAVRFFHGIRQSATSVVAVSRSKHTSCPVGENSYAV